MFPETIQTESLSLRKFGPEHVDVLELYDRFAAGRPGVEDVFEHVPREPYATVADARERLEKADEAWADDEEANYAVYTPGDELAGYAGLFLEWERRTGRLGVTLHRDHLGHGYAVECAHALTDLAFDRLDLELVAIGHEAGNDRSKRAIEKYVDAAGGQYDGVLRNWTPVDDEVLDHHRYTVRRAQYEAATGTDGE